jgi:hypothetical protein
VPTSSAATSTDRFVGNGFIFGVRPNWRALMRCRPSF